MAVLHGRIDFEFVAFCEEGKRRGSGVSVGVGWMGGVCYVSMIDRVGRVVLWMFGKGEWREGGERGRECVLWSLPPGINSPMRDTCFGFAFVLSL